MKLTRKQKLEELEFLVGGLNTIHETYKLVGHQINGTRYAVCQVDPSDAKKPSNPGSQIRVISQLSYYYTLDELLIWFDGYRAKGIHDHIEKLTYERIKKEYV